MSGARSLKTWLGLSTLSVGALWLLVPPLPKRVIIGEQLSTPPPDFAYILLGMALGWVLTRLLLRAPDRLGLMLLSKQGSVPAPSALRDERAQALTEFLIIFPVLLLIVLGIFQFSLAFNGRQFVQWASYQAARSAAVWVALDSETPLDDEADDRIRTAAAMALVPVSMRQESLPSVQSASDRFSGGQWQETVGAWVNSTVGSLETSASTSTNRPFPRSYSDYADSFLSRYDYAALTTAQPDNVRVQVRRANGSWVDPDMADLSDADEVRVSIKYDYYLVMPLIPSIPTGPDSTLGRPHSSGLIPGDRFFTLRATTEFVLERKRGSDLCHCQNASPPCAMYPEE